jgi:preprotein translocase subunit YajC
VNAFFHQIALLAQAPAPAADPAAPGLDLSRLLPMILITGLLFYFIMLRPQKKKEQELRDKINSLKENDRVVTIGGVHGVVTNVQRDAERVTIRVDEATGTKIRFNMSAIARVLTGDDEEGAASGNKS